MSFAADAQGPLPGEPVHRGRRPRHHVERRRDRLRQRAGHRAEPRHRDPVHLHAVPTQRRHRWPPTPARATRCSAYGNRNFFRLFTEVVRIHRRRQARRPRASRGVNVAVNGARSPSRTPSTSIRRSREGHPGARTPAWPRAWPPGSRTSGMPYVWGGGSVTASAPGNGCTAASGDCNGCGSEIGFDCSGLTAYVLASQGGIRLARRELRQPARRRHRHPLGERASRRHRRLPRPRRHLPRRLSTASSTSWKPPGSAPPSTIVPLTRTDRDPVLHRHWSDDHEVHPPPPTRRRHARVARRPGRPHRPAQRLRQRRHDAADVRRPAGRGRRRRRPVRPAP